MKESMKNGRRVISLVTEKELRTYMHPLRQKIRRLLELHPEGLTAKQVADSLSIAPSSAGHHLAALESVGLVGLDRTEQIHGFTAKFYKAAPVDVTLGEANPEAYGLRDVMIRSLVEQALEDWLAAAAQREARGETLDAAYGDVLAGVVHLTPAEAAALHERILAFIAAHGTPRPGTIPYTYALIANAAEEKL